MRRCPISSLTRTPAAMNCLHSISVKSSLLRPQALGSRSSRAPSSNLVMAGEGRRRPPKIVLNVYSGSASSTEKNDAEIEEEKSEIYSNSMTEAMGAVLTYRHELGMNYNFIRPDLIVGSCLQTPADVDKLREIGVKTIFCLQQDSDLEYFSVDIGAIQEYATMFVDIEHCRAEIRDFDAFDLRMRLPAVISKLHKTINRNGGVTYIHCTAGLGRAPAVAVYAKLSRQHALDILTVAYLVGDLQLSNIKATWALNIKLAYMFWVQGYGLAEGHKLLLSKRACFPNLEAIKSATADILTGLPKSHVTLTWEGDNCSSVEVSGLDIGWGQRVPLKFDTKQGLWVLECDLPEGHYEYKYIVDGEWTFNKYELVTDPNSDGHVNNYIHASSNTSTAENKELRIRLTGEDVDLTKEERHTIRKFLDAYSEN